MTNSPNEHDAEPNRFLLVGYLEEALPLDAMTHVEERLRNSSQWREALVSLRDELDFGEHSLATIWRRQRLTCPTRELLGAFLLDGLVPDEAEYVRFHLEIVGCRWCEANLEDVRSSSIKGTEQKEPSAGRRRRFFESSVGYLPDRAR